MGLLTEYKGTISIYQSARWGFTLVTDNPATLSDSDYILLGTVDIDVQFNRAAVVPAAVDALEKMIEKERTDSIARIRVIKEQIASLLSIEHQA